MRVCSPYRRLAAVYDGAIGIPVFRRTGRLFEDLARRFGFRFRNAIDLGCGTGLFCRYLATRWRARVTGVDLSPDMLQVAVRNCRGLPVRLVRADISRLRLPEKADLVTCNFDTLNHLPGPRAVRETLLRAAAHLRPGGWLLFDFLTPCQRIPPHTRISLRAGAVRQTIEWDPGRRTLIISVTLRRRGMREIPAGRQRERLYPFRAIRGWLNEAGLRILFAGAAGPHARGLCAPRLFVLAQRRR